MERLTIRTNEASISFECESVGDIVRRLVTIEDILGDEYDLDELRKMVQAKREGRCVVFHPGYAVMSIYNPADEDGLYTMSATGVITKEEYETALRREQE